MSGSRARSIRKIVAAAGGTKTLYRQTKKTYTRTRWNAGRLTFEPRP